MSTKFPTITMTFQLANIDISIKIFKLFWHPFVAPYSSFSPPCITTTNTSIQPWREDLPQGSITIFPKALGTVPSRKVDLTWNTLKRSNLWKLVKEHWPFVDHTFSSLTPAHKNNAQVILLPQFEPHGHVLHKPLVYPTWKTSCSYHELNSKHSTQLTMHCMGCT
jgi:hypothetical protein